MTENRASNIIRVVAEAVGVVGLIVSSTGNFLQYRTNERLEAQKQDLAEKANRWEARSNLYDFRQEHLNRHLQQLRAEVRRARQYLGNLSSEEAHDIKRSCATLELDREQLIREIQQREAGHVRDYDPDFATTPKDSLDTIGRPTCLESVKLLLAEELLKITNSAQEPVDLERFFRFVRGVKEEWVELVVGGQSANIRDAPKGEVVLAIPPGTRIQVLFYRRGDGWLRVSDPNSGRQGWIWSRLVIIPPSSILIGPIT